MYGKHGTTISLINEATSVLVQVCVYTPRYVCVYLWVYLYMNMHACIRTHICLNVCVLAR